MTRVLERFLSLQPGDFSRGLLLSAYLFLIITSYILGKVVRDSLFLDQFDANQLPLADITVAVMVGFVVTLYVRLSRWLKLRDLLVISLVAYIGTAVAFWWVASQGNQLWIYPAIYVFVGIYGVLAPAQVWTLANYVMTTREAKRIFGLVGSGAIAGGIFGGYFATFATEKFGPESLLLWEALLLSISAVLVVLIWRQRNDREGSATQQAPKSAVAAQASLWQSVKLVRSSSYLQAIAAVICLSSFVTTFAGWQLKSLAAHELVDKTALALFFGNFYFYAGILALLTQLLLTGRVLRRFGIGPALFILPVALMSGTLGVLIWGTLFAAAIMKGSDQVLRYSVDKSTVELLYLPVPSEIKVQVKSFIDTVIWRFGDGLSGLALLLFATILGWSPQQVSWINLILILGWMSAAWVARIQYVATLQKSIREHRLDAERASAPVLDRSTAEIFSRKLTDADPEEILYALSLFEVSPALPSLPPIQELLQHTDPRVRCKAIVILSATQDKAAAPAVEKLLHDDDFEVRTEAMLFLAHHSQFDPLAHIQELKSFPDFSMQAAIIAFLSRQGPSPAAQIMFRTMVADTGAAAQRTRIEAARLLGMLPDHFEEETRMLLNDPDAEVVRHTLISIGKLQKAGFLPSLVTLLDNPELAPTAEEALAHLGSVAVPKLSEYLTDPDVSSTVRQKIAGLFVKIGTPSVLRTLQENIIEADTALRFRIISALNKLHQDHPEIPVNEQMVENLLEAEILGHYRSYQILSVLEPAFENKDTFVQHMTKSMEQDLERIFRLLSLLIPEQDLHSAYFGLRSHNALMRDNALEFLDHILKPEIRTLLIPVLDSEVNQTERVRLANRTIGASLENKEEAVLTLLLCKDSWLKTCGVYAIGVLGLKSLESNLEPYLEDDDSTLREAAREAKLHLQSAQS